jgi:hypothetical protein
MAIHVKEIPGQGGINSSGWRFTREFRVRRDEDLIPPRSAIQSVIDWAGFTIGDPYEIYNQNDELIEYQTDAFCSSFDADTISDVGGRGRIVVAEFTKSETVQNPLLMPVREEWDFIDGTVPIERDATGKLIRNSIGDPFEQALETDATSLVVTLIRNELSRPRYAIPLLKKINSQAWYGFPQKTVLLHSMRPRQQTHPVYGDYFECSFTFHINLNGFTRYVLNQGYRQKSMRGSSIINIEEGGENVTVPKKLSLAGFPLPADAPGIFLPFEPYYVAPFSLLGF